ncbi:MAG TPA: hypothetical protein DEB24_03895 [Coriobacteriia bacterium]|nr:hypothetical protein [Coriobacteriia bacterium]
MEKRGRVGVLPMMLAVLSVMALVACTPTPGTNPDASGTQAQSQTPSTPAADVDISTHLGKYTLYKYTDVSGENLDSADLDVLFSDSGGTAESFVDIFDEKNLYLALGENKSTYAYTKVGNTLTLKDSMGNELDMIWSGAELSIEFSDQIQGTQGQAYTVYFLKGL